MKPLKVMIGTDPRQPVAWVVLANSIARHSSVPVEIVPLVLKQLPITRRGMTEFTMSRFLTPWLTGFRGRAVFLDADMIVTRDIADLFNSFDYSKSVYVMQDQPRFEWPSMMAFNCGNCQKLTPEFVQDEKNGLFDLSWADHGIGTLPKEWNHCVSYAEPREDAKLVHFTAGLPIWPETSGQNGHPEDNLWLKEAKIAVSSCSYKDLMGGSVHAQRKVS
jgi:thiol-disulfide isomerase/thioredoxin